MIGARKESIDFENRFHKEGGDAATDAAVEQEACALATQTITHQAISHLPTEARVSALASSPGPLSKLPVGRKGRVLGLMPGTVLDATMTRVLLLGLVPGTEIEVVRRAPLGDPTEYELRGYRLCLRSSEANQIQVQPLPSSPETRA